MKSDVYMKYFALNSAWVNQQTNEEKKIGTELPKGVTNSIVIMNVSL